jgi:hypothetical protein
MRVHFLVAGVLLIGGAVGLAAYLFSLQLSSLDLAWGTLHIDGEDKIYEADAQIQLLLTLVLGLASLIMLRAARQIGQQQRRARWTARLAALLLMAGFPLAWVVWQLDLAFLPAAISTWGVGALALLLALEAGLAVWYLLALFFSNGVHQTLAHDDLTVHPAFRRIQRIGIGVWLLVVVGLGVTLGVMSDWLYELPVPHPDPGELLYVTSFDASFAEEFDTDQFEWDTYDSQDEAQIVLKADMVLADSSPPPADKWMVVTYGSGRAEGVVWTTLDRKFNDMDLRLTARLISGVEEDSTFGVLFRYRDKDNFYIFQLTGDGYYSLGKVKNGQRQTISDWTTSPAIRQGNAENTLRIQAYGDKFRFFVNGEPLPLCLPGQERYGQWDPAPNEAGICLTADPAYVYRDDDFTQGQVGLATGSFYGDSVIEAGFDDLVITGPEPSSLDTIFPGQTLYSASFNVNEVYDAYTDEWETYEGENAAQLLHSARLAVADDRHLPFAGGLLVLTHGVEQPDGLTWSALDRTFTALDVVVPMWPAAGPVDNQMGVLFRYQSPDNYYAFLISSDGYYKLAKVVDGRQEVISAWGRSAAIHSLEAANTLRVVAVEDTFRFFVNDEVLPLCPGSSTQPSVWDAPGECASGDITFAYQDDTFPQGQIALAAGSGDDVSRPVVIVVDDVFVRQPVLEAE